MSAFQFSLIVPMAPMNHEQILDMAETLGRAGCTDASVRGHAEGVELLFQREAESLQAALRSAIADVEKAGYQVERVEMQREAIPG